MDLDKESARKLRVGIVGASGYSGSALAQLVSVHPRLSLAFATSDKRAGESLSEHLGVRFDGDVRWVSNASAIERAGDCDAVLLATSAEISMQLAPAFAKLGRQVVDLSGAFRLEAEAYPRWYGMKHAAPVWLERAHYGLPELFGAPPPGSLVSNPGCYPTALLMALAPLLREGLIEPTGIVVDGKSGVTGAGRQSGDAYSFGAVDENLRAYKPLVHQHTPEMVRALTRIADGVTLTFVPHLLPVKRGLLTTAYARPRAGQGVSAARVAQCLADSYAGSAFVRAMAPDRVMLSGVVGTNDCHVGAAANDDIVVAVGALDNLLKGAAGQAIQNLNLINGWDERAGLGALHRASL